MEHFQSKELISYFPQNASPCLPLRICESSPHTLGSIQNAVIIVLGSTTLLFLMLFPAQRSLFTIYQVVIDNRCSQHRASPSHSDPFLVHRQQVSSQI